MYCILEHKPGVGPTKNEIKQAVIQRLLDIEYAPRSRFHEEDPDSWDTERQMLVLRCGWNNMSLEELIELLPE